jgi:penicillin-binding protein 1A
MSHSSRIRQRRRDPHPMRWVLLGLGVVLLCGLLAAAAGAGWIVRTANSAPPLSSLKAKDYGQLSQVFAADGTSLGYIQSDNLRTPIPSSQIPKVLKQATVAIEDKRFYEHKGVDYEGIIRALVKNVQHRKTLQGGSTLTMQLVRNLYPYEGSKTRTGIQGVERKIKEAKLAKELEDEHSKDWVLSEYINIAPYGTVGGQTAYGADAAAHTYFNKSAKHLTLIEAAMLAGMPQAPSEYSPVNAQALTRQRRNEVLAKMAEQKMITPEQAKVAEAKTLGLHMDGYYQHHRESFFLDYVKNELNKEYGAATVKRGGFKVYTTIDLKKQKEARAAIQDKMTNVVGKGGPSSAIVTINPKNGDIVTMASSADYGQSNFNLAAQGHRQPGSSFKVMALMTALREGVNPDTTFYDSHSPTEIDQPQCGSPFSIKTYGGESNGSISLHQATLKSDNSVYIQLASDLGPDKVKETARMMGIKSKLNGFCAETLGGLEDGVSPLEMADAYATIASGGYRNRPRAIRKVVFPDGSSELPARWKVHRVKAFDTSVTYEATKILEDNVQGGTGTHAQFGCPAAGKTGTTDHNTDAWFVGFTPRLSTAVWVGYPKSIKIQMNGLYFGRNVDGGTFPADIWGVYTKAASGKFCGAFTPSTQPFQSQPFFGHYASTGKKEHDKATDDKSKNDSKDKTKDTKQGADGGHDTGDKTYDPNKYETPPQPTPTVGAPGTTAPTTPGGGTQAPGTKKP